MLYYGPTVRAGGRASGEDRQNRPGQHQRKNQ